MQEVKFGFIPGSQDTNASRVRRRYRLQKGGHSQLVLVHYTRGPATRELSNPTHVIYKNDGIVIYVQLS